MQPEQQQQLALNSFGQISQGIIIFIELQLIIGVKIGFNRGRILTYKLKQQFDVDEFYEWENFSFERSVGKDVSLVKCQL